MRLHRFGADHEFLCDLGSDQPIGDQLQDLGLSLGQTFRKKRVCIAAGRSRRSLPPVRFGNTSGFLADIPH